MHSKKDSILKRWHTLTANPKRLAKKWQGQYWTEQQGIKNIACANCPSLNSATQACSIQFGSPLRKCVVSSIEAHLHNCMGQNVLEIGFGKFKLAKMLVTRSGGTWSGIEPRRPESEKATIGKGGYGHATYIPFEDNCFDKVFAIQSIEHWGQKAGALREPSSYKECFAEILRVLKPGGDIYFDAPAHFHGNEMFVMGDIEKVKSYLPESHWENVQIEQWRKQHQPLEKFSPPEKMVKDWPIEITQYEQTDVDEIINNASVWMMAITATKLAS